MVRSWGLQFWNFGTVGDLQSSKFQKLQGPRSPEWLWSGHVVCSFGILGGLQSSKVPQLHRPRSPGGYGQVMGSAVLELWNFAGPPKFQRHPKTDLGPQSGYGQVMGFAVLELLNLGVFLQGGQILLKTNM